MKSNDVKEEKDNNKVILLIGIVVSILVVLVFSAAYAYFSVTSTNNFGSSTINTTAEATGSVALNGTSAILRLNLSGADMMKGEDDITYWATSDGTPSTTQNIVTIGSTQVTGAGYYNCDYTLSVTGTGTNNMYTAFQGMSGKSTEQIVLKIGDTKYDFNTANLFPITINGTLEGVTSSDVKSLTAEFYLVNKETVVQNALAGTGINIAISATSFSCDIAEAPQEIVTYYTYESADTWGPHGTISAKEDSPNASWQYYIKEIQSQAIADEDIYEQQYYEDGELIHIGQYKGLSACQADSENCVKIFSNGDAYTAIVNEVCAVFNNSSNGTICIKSSDSANVSNLYTKMHNLGLICNDYQNDGFLRCTNGSDLYQAGSIYCIITDDGANCGIAQDGSCDASWVSNHTYCSF